jgi:hypothetical protein
VVSADKVDLSRSAAPERSPWAAGDQARRQEGKPPRARPRAAKATRLLTACCARYHEASGGAVGSTDAGRTTTNAEGRGKQDRFAPSPGGRTARKRAIADAVETNAALSASGSQHASDEPVARLPDFRVGKVRGDAADRKKTSAAKMVRMFDHAMTMPVSAGLSDTRRCSPVVICAPTSAVGAHGHTIGSN